MVGISCPAHVAGAFTPTAQTVSDSGALRLCANSFARPIICGSDKGLQSGGRTIIFNCLRFSVVIHEAQITARVQCRAPFTGRDVASGLGCDGIAGVLWSIHGSSCSKHVRYASRVRRRCERTRVRGGRSAVDTAQVRKVHAQRSFEHAFSHAKLVASDYRAEPVVRVTRPIRGVGLGQDGEQESSAEEVSHDSLESLWVCLVVYVR